MEGREPSAEQLKNFGNEAFKEQNFRLAETFYTQAIEQADGPNAVFYNNRSMARFHLGLFGLSIEDATHAITINDRYEKAYFRRAEAHLALSKLAEAKADYQIALSIRPSDKRIHAKLASVNKKIKMERFARAIADTSTLPIFALDPSKMTYSAAYKGPVIDAEGAITPELFQGVLAYCEAGKSLPAPAFAALLRMAHSLLSTEKPLVRVTIPATADEEPGRPALTVVGDIHGQVFDLAFLLKQIGVPRPGEAVVFLGDYVDRRDHGLSVLQILLAYKLCAPDRVFLLRGNHEEVNMNRQFGFAQEVTSKFRPIFFDAILNLFDQIPLAALINNRAFAVHGGLPVSSMALPPRIEALAKGSVTNSVAQEMLWSDPQEVSGLSPSPRGCGFQYGADRAAAWMGAAGVNLVFRAHQMNYDGIRHDFTVGSTSLGAGRWHLTVFSAPNYCMESNRGRVVRMTRAQLQGACDGVALNFSTIDLETNPTKDPLAKQMPTMPDYMRRQLFLGQKTA